MKPGLSREASAASGQSSGEKTENAIRFFSTSSYIQQRSISDDDDIQFRPAPILGSQVSVHDHRRSKLATILREPESLAAITNQWMDLIEEKRETEILDTEKLRTLLGGICDYLDTGNEEFLEKSLSQICDEKLRNTDQTIRVDLERSFYHFIKASSIHLAKFNLPLHESFALDNINRHIAEHLLGLIRTDFLPASKSMLPITPSHDSPVQTPAYNFHDEAQVLDEEYRTIAQRNHELLQRLLAIEKKNESQFNTMFKQEVGLFLPAKSISPEQSNSKPHLQSARGIKRSRELIELEQEHECLLKKLMTNRTRINQILHS